MKLVDAAAMRAIDNASIYGYGVKGLQLMENAGRGAADIIKRELKAMPGGSANRSVSIIAGKGNNGGDGFAAARHLKNSGIRASVFLLSGIGDIKGDAGENAASWLKMGGEVFTVSSDGDLEKYESRFRHSSVIVDALFGTGLSSDITGLHAGVIRLINSLDKKVVAIDIPSGIDAATGCVLGCAVKADITATMALPKLGLYLYPGRSYAGLIEVIDIGAPACLLEDSGIKWGLITVDGLKAFLKPREPDAHKGAFGHLLIIAGSPGLTGAAYMCGTSSMRAGAGLATIALPEGLNRIMEAKTTEVMTLPLPETEEGGLGPESYERLRPAMKGKRAIVIGPGLGASHGVFGLMERILKEAEAPVVIDADGLNALAGRITALKGTKAKIILTPHPGEAGRLLGVETADIQKDRVKAAERLVKETGATVILKGAGSVVATPEGEVFVNQTGNPGLATAGTGDVLSGMVGGFLAQGRSPSEAARAAVYIHGLAADMIKMERGEAGMMAMDLLPLIPGILSSITRPVER